MTYILVVVVCDLHNGRSVTYMMMVLLYDLHNKSGGV